MQIKCLRRGTGSARAAVDYLVGERDAAGHRREGVEVLRGNPDHMAAVADSLEFERKYTSVVIAWAPDDQPTDAQIGAVFDEFEKTAWAGLAPDRSAWTAVLHRERGAGVHAHVLAAPCDLETGRRVNIAPPGWQKTFDPLRDAFNHQHGWSRPDDPARARAHQPGHRAYIEASKLRAGLEHEADPRALIRDYLVQRVEHAVVRSRAAVGSAREEVGFEVPRQGRNYVTARDPDSGKRWRLKGALDEHDFEPERRDVPAAPPAQIEETAAGELLRLGESLNAVVSGALRTIEADTVATVARVRVLLLNAWLRPLVVGLSLFLAFSGGSWALMHWLSASIQSRIETLAALKLQIEQARETVAEIEEATWGVTLREIDGERFAVLPDGALDDPPWSVGGRPALKLSSE